VLELHATAAASRMHISFEYNLKSRVTVKFHLKPLKYECKNIFTESASRIFFQVVHSFVLQKFGSLSKNVCVKINS
jgi:hypothetical protein